jgi:hypothetical protein
MAPPAWFSTAPAKLERTIKAIADHGARFVGANLLFLDGGTRDHFMRFLADGYPALVDQFDRLYASKYAPKDYAERVKKTVGMLKARYGLGNRRRASADGADGAGDDEQDAVESTAAPAGAREASQAAFSWTA